MSSPTGTTRLLTALGRYGVRSGSSSSETSPDAAATPRLPQISPTSSSSRFSATAGWQSASLERARAERVRVEAEKWRAYASRNRLDKQARSVIGIDDGEADDEDSFNSGRACSP